MTSERREDGNTLVLMPMAVLVLVALAGIAVDSAAAFLGQRRLSDVAAGLANDAVAGLSEERFYGDGDIEIAEARAEDRRDVVLDDLAVDASLDDVVCTVTAGVESATVACTATARPIFGRAVPGTLTAYQLSATEVARAAQD